MKKNFYRLASVLILFSIQANDDHSRTNFEWVAVAKMPAPEHDIMGAELNGKLYVAGGLGSFPRPSDEIWELSDNPWKWRAVAKLSHPRIYAATVAFAGKIWVLGGDIMNPAGIRETVKTAEIYDPQNNKVTMGPDSLVYRAQPMALVGNNRLYVIGAESGKSQLPCPMESLGVEESQWHEEANGPLNMECMAGTSFHNKFYIDTGKSQLAVFDSVSKIWQIILLPKPTRSCQMAAYQNEIWMIGGRGFTGTSIFDPASKNWMIGPALPFELSWGAAGVVNDKLVVTGGATYTHIFDNGSRFSDLTYVLQPKRKK